MELKEWRKNNRWTIRAMAKEIGANESVLSSVNTKNRKPSLLLAKAIVQFTGGEVSLADLEIEEK